MRKRTLSLLLALVLVCLPGCRGETGDAADDPMAAYDGTWYFAKNGVACEFGDGKIYRDDKDAQEGQTLTGIYDWSGDHIDAHIANTGGLKDPKPLYVVSSDGGDLLCDSADGSGTIYFYKNALTALAALEASELAQAASLPAQSPGPDAPSAEDPASAAEPPQAASVDAEESASPSEDRPLSEASLGSPSPAPEPSATQTNGSSVWVSRSGSKYHRDPTCSGMKSPSKISRSEAESKGYAPCKRCYG